MPEIGPTLDRRLAEIDREISGLGTCGWAKATLTPEVREAARREPERLRTLARQLDAHAKECTICRLRDEAIERMDLAMDDSWGSRWYSRYRVWYRRLPVWLQPAVKGGAIMGSLAIPNSIAIGLVHLSLTWGALVMGLSIAVGTAAGLVAGNAHRLLKPKGKERGIAGSALAGMAFTLIVMIPTCLVLRMVPETRPSFGYGGMGWVAAAFIVLFGGPILGFAWLAEPGEREGEG